MNFWPRTTSPVPGVLLLFTVACQSAAGITIETVPVGNPGNPGDTETMTCCGPLAGTSGHGSVLNEYRIGKFEVTNTQYVVFLNSVDPTGTNTLELYDGAMTSDGTGGIDFASGAPDGSKYGIKSGRGHNPVAFVSWYDAIRFANWLHNGQESGDTETGAYTILGGTPTPSNGETITRNTGARWWLPNQDEWYKAAYHKNDGVTGNYWNYATSSDADPYSDQPPGSDAPDASRTANFNWDDGIDNGYDDGFAVTGAAGCMCGIGFSSFNYLTDVGAYAQSASPYGTFDQAGNLFEWNETLIQGYRGSRGGSWLDLTGFMQSSYAGYGEAWSGDLIFGFRVATLPIPEPATIYLAALGCFALLSQRRRVS